MRLVLQVLAPRSMCMYTTTCKEIVFNFCGSFLKLLRYLASFETFLTIKFVINIFSSYVPMIQRWVNSASECSVLSPIDAIYVHNCLISSYSYMISHALTSSFVIISPIFAEFWLMLLVIFWESLREGSASMYTGSSFLWGNYALYFLHFSWSK